MAKKLTNKQIAALSDEEREKYYDEIKAEMKTQIEAIKAEMKKEQNEVNAIIRRNKAKERAALRKKRNHALYYLSGEWIKRNNPITAKSLIKEVMSNAPERTQEGLKILLDEIEKD